MTDVEQMKNAKKKAEDTLKSLEAKKLSGEITQSEYEAWKREFTGHVKKLTAMLEEMGVQGEDQDREKSIDARMQMYLRPEVQAVLKDLLNGSSEHIVPIFDWTYGDRYPRIEEGSGLKPEDAKPLIDRLYEAGVLQREFHDVFVKCPKCNSFAIRSRLQCSSCGSSNIIKGEVIEHFKCGHSDFTHYFKQKHGNYICPKCKAELKQIGVDYQKPGIWFKCQACSELFGVPASRQYCNACGALFDKEEAVLFRIYSYKLSPYVKKEVESALLVVSPIKEHLSKLGMNVESPATLAGLSGAKHQFMVAISDSSGGETRPIVIDLASSETRVDVNQVLSFFAKACDIDALAKLLVGIPSFNEDAKRVASSYGIMAVEASDRKLIPSLLVKFAESITKTNAHEVRKEIDTLRSALEAEDTH